MQGLWRVMVVAVLVLLAQVAAQTDWLEQGKSAGSALTKDWLLGRWVARDPGGVFTFEARANGTYTWQIAKATGEAVYSEEAQWSLENGRLKQTWKNPQTTLVEVSFYEPERISDTAMRWRGGNFGLKTLLFQRVQAGQVSPVSSWLVGSWTSIFVLDNLNLNLFEDGRFGYRKENPLSGEAETREGTWTYQNGVLSLQGDSPVQYRVSAYSDVSINLTGGEFAGSSQLFQRANTEPRDPLKPLQFAGQYIQKETTLTVVAAGAGYEARLLNKGQMYALSGQAEGDTLKLASADGKIQYALRLENNGLYDTNLYNFTRFYQKVAEGTLAVLTKPVGYWINTKGFDQDDDLLLLPDGRYRQAQYFDLGGKRSSSITEGKFTLKSDKLTLDPVCASPSTFTLKQVQNHFLVSFTSSLTNQPVTTTYMATPASSLEYQLTQAKLRDGIEAQVNAVWQKKIALGPVKRLGRIPPTNEISVDLNPNDVFAKATVFANNEIYPYQSEAFYFYDFNGNFRSATPGMLIIDQALSQSINYSLGQYHDKQNTYFFPNGRTITYVETYLDAKKITHPPVPNVKFFWNKYRIEGDKIIIGSSKPFVYELLRGRRWIRASEQCFENLKFSLEASKK